MMRNAAFDTEPRATPQSLDGTQGVLGNIGATTTLNAVDSGWWDSTGYHDSTNKNYAAGRSGGIDLHDYFVFDLTSVTNPIASAQLDLLNPAGGYTSPAPTETYSVFDASTPVSSVEADGVGETAIFDDLGSGTNFGAQTVSAADDDEIVPVTLNAAAVSSLNSSRGTQVAVGGALTTLAGTDDQVVFGYGGSNTDTRQLVLTTLEDDWYSITITSAHTQLNLATSTPGGAANNLAPKIELYNPSWTLVASGIVGADGRNETLQYVAPAPGVYRIRVVSNNAAAGQYFLSCVQTPVGTTRTWDGGGADNHWMTAANWVGDVAPVAGDRLVFAGSTQTSSFNDFAAGTVFQSIAFQNGGFSLSGNAVTLNPQSGVAIDNVLGDNAIALPLTLAAAATGTTIVENGALQLADGAENPVLDSDGGANIQGGTLVLDYSGGPDLAPQVQTLLATSYHNYTTYPFDSGQLRSSAASTTVGLGWADSPTISGHLYSNQVVILPSLYGDATLDGVVGPADLSKLLTNYGKSSMAWAQGDFAYDGVIGPADLSRLLTNYGKTGPVTISVARSSALDSQTLPASSSAAATTGAASSAARQPVATATASSPPAAVPPASSVAALPASRPPAAALPASSPPAAARDVGGGTAAVSAPVTVAVSADAAQSGPPAPVAVRTKVSNAAGYWPKPPASQPAVGGPGEIAVLSLPNDSGQAAEATLMPVKVSAPSPAAVDGQADKVKASPAAATIAPVLEGVAPVAWAADERDPGTADVSLPNQPRGQAAAQLPQDVLFSRWGAEAAQLGAQQPRRAEDFVYEGSADVEWYGASDRSRDAGPLSEAVFGRWASLGRT